MSDIVEIKEYSSQVIKDFNNSLDLLYLKKPCFKYETAKPYRISWTREGSPQVDNTSYAGIIQLEKTRIYFSTKVKTNLFYMLSFLKDESSFHYDSDIIIDIKEGANFFDILGRMFLNELENISKKGFYKTYIKKEENISFLKGKLELSKQLRNDAIKKTKFYCSYGDLTFDNLENRIILKATTLLIPLIRFNTKIKKELIRYSYILKKEVNLVNIIPEDCEKIKYSRLNDYYETIIQFSKVILRNYFIRSTHKGDAKGFNFIVNMNKVYEDFVTEITEDIVNNEPEFCEYIVERQEKFNSLFREKQIITKPDILLRKRDTEEYPLIIDAKYKKQEVHSDLYQVTAYALAIPSARACCLLYPEKEPVQNPILTLEAGRFGGKRPDIKIHTKKIKLFLDSEANFDEYITMVREEIKAKLLSCLNY